MKTTTKMKMINNKLSPMKKQSCSVTPLSTALHTWKQSPKISTKKARLYLPPTCDTSTINNIAYVIKRKESQTPKLNVQYKRMSDEDLSQMFPKSTNTLNAIRKHNLFLKYKNESIKNTNNNKQLYNTTLNETQQQQHNNKIYKRTQSAIYNNNNKTFNTFYQTHNINKTFKLSKDDKWKPTSYREIELQLHNPKLIKNQFIFNIPSPQEISRQSNNSDIFNIQPSQPFIPPSQNQPSLLNPTSDVFHIHCDSTHINISNQIHNIKAITQ